MKTKRWLIRQWIFASALACAVWAPVSYAAPATQTFNVYGRAQLSEGARRVMTPFVGTLTVDPQYVDPTFGIVGRVQSINLHFLALSDAGPFDRIIAQGPEISGLTALKYDVTAVNAAGEQVQFQFSTRQSPAHFPGMGTPMGSLVNFSRGMILEGSTGPIAMNGDVVYLQGFRGQVWRQRPGVAR